MSRRKTVREEIQAAVKSTEFVIGESRLEGSCTASGRRGHYFPRVGEVPMYSVDGLARRADALQATQKIVAGELQYSLASSKRERFRL